jgi:uridine kinase
MSLPPILIGFSGYTACGKSTLVKNLEHEGLGKRFRIDVFYKDKDDSTCPYQNGRPHWNLPESMHHEAMYETLAKLKQGKTVEIPLYSRGLSKRVGTSRFEPRPLIFVEGMWLFFQQKICDLLDYRFWIDFPLEKVYERRLDRQPEYSLEEHETMVIPCLKNYIDPLKHQAHIIIDGTKKIDILTKETKKLIQKFLKNQKRKFFFP